MGRNRRFSDKNHVQGQPVVNDSWQYGMFAILPSLLLTHRPLVIPPRTIYIHRTSDVGRCPVPQVVPSACVHRPTIAGIPGPSSEGTCGLGVSRLVEAFPVQDWFSCHAHPRWTLTRFVMMLKRVELVRTWHEIARVTPFRRLGVQVRIVDGTVSAGSMTLR